MLNIVLFQPEIPPNTGNLIRLCANAGFSLHLIEPLGFSLDDKLLRRAGLDYREFATVQVHGNFAEYRTICSDSTIYACSTKGRTCYTEPRYHAGDTLLFGPETRGLPLDLLDSLAASQVIHIPMQAHSRSMNLANAVAVVAFEAWRQLDFAL